MRGRAASTGSCRTSRCTPPYSRQRQERPETQPDITEDPLPKACEVLPVSDLFRFLPAQMVSKPGVMTHVIDGYIIQESLQPFPSTTTATKTSIVGAQRYHHVSRTMPSMGMNAGTSGAITQAVPAKQKPPQSLDLSFVGKPAITKPFQVHETSTMKLTPKRKTPSLACKNIEELHTTSSKTTSFVPGAAATPKFKLINGTPLEDPSTSPWDSVTSQASSALLTTPQHRHPEPTYPLHNWSNSPEKWTVDDVAQYVSGSPGCEGIAEKFRYHEIDGGALFLIKEHHLMTTMDMKLGPALKMCATIASLRDVSQDKLVVRVGI
ncbi:hypothetical protein HPB51_014477 [Rhipicephalus microplus]|uniref:SAM domain-containing protein n=1 Tax=Rhipicephalus microplus TaxID=6941 RepID=A0A9J6EAI5_RHIMP|nr:hypothetical protein HPB51_014477 [Rhipicephalus microplus]